MISKIISRLQNVWDAYTLMFQTTIIGLSLLIVISIPVMAIYRINILGIGCLIILILSNLIWVYTTFRHKDRALLEIPPK